MIHLNVESKDNFEIVKCEPQFFKSYKVISKFYYITNYPTFQAITIKMAKFQHKTILKRSKLQFTFFSSRLKVSGKGLKLKVVGICILFYL